MARFSDAAKRDPYRNFSFRIRFGNEVVAACRKMSALDVTVQTTPFRAGDSRTATDEKLPGRTQYGDITFEAGVTDNRLFETWANQLADLEARPVRLQDPQFRREVTIEVMDLDRTTVARTYVLHRAWVSKYTAMSDLAGDGNDVLIETLQVTHEGFTREPNAGA
jgi:phage tail-like protein